jgi:hypothetical protein
MNPRNYDPPEYLGYLDLVNTVARGFRKVASAEELIAILDARRPTDITDVPEIQSMEAAQPLPASFTQRVYQFRDRTLGHGVMDAAFHDGELVNIRAQLIFAGWFGTWRARRFLRDALVPVLCEVFGSPSEQTLDFSVFCSSGLIAVARYVPGTPSVSAALTDDRFA